MHRVAAVEDEGRDMDRGMVEHGVLPPAPSALPVPPELPAGPELPLGPARPLLDALGPGPKVSPGVDAVVRVSVTER